MGSWVAVRRNGQCNCGGFGIAEIYDFSTASKYHNDIELYLGGTCLSMLQVVSMTAYTVS